MRIIKDKANAIDIIAGEIVNIEQSSLKFVDGKPVEPTPGYPRVIVGDVHNIVRAAGGYIIVPDDVDIEIFAKTLMIVVRGIDNTDDSNYQSVKSHVANVKAKSPQQLTNFINGSSRHHKGKNDRRLFVQWDYNVASRTFPARFTWIIVHTTDFETGIVSTDIGDAISRHVTSIFYDRDNICALEHNAVTMTFGDASMRANDLVIDKNVQYDARVDPALTNIRPNSGSLYHIPKTKLYQAKFTDVVFADAEKLACEVCNGLIWGEFYAAHGLIDNPSNIYSVALCARCGHTATNYHVKYMRFLRMTAPRTREQAMANVDPLLRDIINEMSAGVEIDDRHGTECVLIGAKYISMSKRKFLYTSISQKYPGRKLVNLS